MIEFFRGSLNLLIATSIVGVLALASHSKALAASPIDSFVFMTEEYPPLNYTEKSKTTGKVEVKGISIEIMEKIFQRVGSKLTLKDIKVYPWARGYTLVQEQKNHVLFTMTRSEKREKLFSWVGPIKPSKIVVWARKDKNISISSLSELNTYKTGEVSAIREDIGEQLLLQGGVKKDSIRRLNLGTKGAELLNMGETKVWAYGETIARWNFKQQGFKSDDFEPVYTLKESGHYIAFHKNAPKEVVQLMQKHLDALKKDGTVQRIIDSYTR